MTCFVHLIENRGLFHLTGSDVQTYLQGILTNDVHKVFAGENIYAALLTPQGKFLYDFFLYPAEDGILLEYFKPKKDDIYKKLLLYRLHSKVTITDVSDAYFVAAAWGNVAGLSSSKDPRHENFGLRFVTKTKPASASATAEDYHLHRIMLTIPEMPDDLISGESFPLPSNMEAIHAIDYKKGCYVGQEVTARSKYRGNIRKKIYTAKIDGIAPAPQTPVYIDDKNVGVMLSHAGAYGLVQIEIEAAEKNISLQAGESILTIA